MIILGIETSCDETSSSILKDGEILSNIIFSQEEHAIYGGVIPEIASKNHEKLLYDIVKKSIVSSKIKISDIAAISVTCGPGLVSSLMVGINFAKGMALGLNIPIIGINHLEGHILSNFINNNEIIEYPFLSLLVSGGHTQIIFVEKDKYSIIAKTVDDAAGEAFDKGAKILGFKYPGGPEIEKAAKNGDSSKYKFKIPNVKSNNKDFSFSGIKTALFYLTRDMSLVDLKTNLNSIAASYQKVIIDTLLQKLHICLQAYKVNKVCIVGGVSANKYFRERAKNFSMKNDNIIIQFPDFKFCTDNAAMIAMTGYIKLKKKYNYSRNIYPDPNLNF